MSSTDSTSGADVIQKYARLTGVLILASIVFGTWGEAIVPARLLVAGDAGATARNIVASPLLFRTGFAAYLVEAACDITLALLFYVLLRPVNRNLALLSAFFGIAATVTYAFAECFFYAPLLLLNGADYLRVFTPDQLNALALLSFKLFGTIAGIFIGFYGIATIIRGYLVYRSRYLPRVLGALFMLGGAAFVADNLAIVLAPSYATPLLLFLMAPAGVAMLTWLLVKGVHRAEWSAAVNAPRTFAPTG
ncbi:MAG TPA: DUF4386 domain-containing protein [Gemmatimonadaceae bacterium]|jgi:hypothetical protein